MGLNLFANLFFKKLEKIITVLVPVFFVSHCGNDML